MRMGEERPPQKMIDLLIENAKLYTSLHLPEEKPQGNATDIV